MNMARMPFTGASIATPSGSREELERTLRDLGVGGAFDAPNIEDLYSRLGFIIGRWSSERAAINVSIVAEELASAETKLNELSVLLGEVDGHQLGGRPAAPRPFGRHGKDRGQPQSQCRGRPALVRQGVQLALARGGAVGGVGGVTMLGTASTR